MTDLIRQMLLESADTKRLLADTLAPEIARLAGWLLETYQKGGKLLLLGNGGSMCDASHIAEEFVGRYKKERRAMPAMALTEPSLLTAIGNDYGFETIFRRQVEAWTQPGDMVIGLSTSGRSANVLAALRLAREFGARTVAFTGAQGLSDPEAADLVLAVPSHNTPRIQECHITMGHIVCEIVEQELFPED